MTGAEVGRTRKAAGIPGGLLCARLGWDRAKLSNFERGYAKLSAAEADRLNAALDELIRAKRVVLDAARAAGWPPEAL